MLPHETRCKRDSAAAGGGFGVWVCFWLEAELCSGCTAPGGGIERKTKVMMNRKESSAPLPIPAPPEPRKKETAGGAGLRTGAAAQYSLKAPVQPLPALDRI